MANIVLVNSSRTKPKKESDVLIYLKQQGVILTDKQRELLMEMDLTLHNLIYISFPNDFNELCTELDLKFAPKLKLKTAIKNLQHESNINNSPSSIMPISHEIPLLMADDINLNTRITTLNDTNISFSIALVGDSGVGKTSIIQRFVTNEFDPFVRDTIGMDQIVKNVMVLDTICKLKLLDTAGQEKYGMPSIGNWLYRVSHAFIICYDISDKQSFDAIPKWLSKLDERANEYSKRFIVGTKIDLGMDDNKENSGEYHPGSSSRQISYDQGKQFAEENGCKFMEVSAKSGSNIKQLFTTVSLYLIRDKVVDKMGVSTMPNGELDKSLMSMGGKVTLSRRVSEWNSNNNPSPSTCRCSFS